MSKQRGGLAVVPPTDLLMNFTALGSLDTSPPELTPSYSQELNPQWQMTEKNFLKCLQLTYLDDFPVNGKELSLKGRIAPTPMTRHREGLPLTDLHMYSTAVGSLNTPFPPLTPRAKTSLHQTEPFVTITDDEEEDLLKHPHTYLHKYFSALGSLNTPPPHMLRLEGMRGQWPHDRNASNK